MVDYFDFQMLIKSMSDKENDSISEEKRLQREQRSHDFQRNRPRRIFDPHLYHVRPSICVAGFSSSAIQRVKNAIAGLTEAPLPLESFHVKGRMDVKDGALLVPKVILVAVHCPGKKLIDDDGDSGQLDYIYDEVCELGADVLVVYLDLPKIVYPVVKNCVYHPKIADFLFPSQPTLQSLAIDYGLVTVTEDSDFNQIQKNIIREWISRPVGDDHQVYQTARWSFSEAESYWSENEAQIGGQARRRAASAGGAESTRWERGFISATDELPVVSGNRKSKKKWKKRGVYGTLASADNLLVTSSRRTALTSLAEDTTNVLELDFFNDAFGYHDDSVRTELV